MSRKRKRKSKLEKFVRRMWRKYRGTLYARYIDAICWWDQCWPMGVWYNLWYGISNLVRWLPLIWRDRDWDAWMYLLPLMEKKLGQIERCEREFALHVGKEKTIRQLQICKNLISRLRADDYIDWTSYLPESYSWKGVGIIKHRLKRPLFAHDHEKEMKKQDLDLLFKIMRRHIGEWWN